MTLRKVSDDNSVKYIPQNEQTKDIKPTTMKNNSLPRKQNKIFSQNKKLIKDTIRGELKGIQTN